jgi:hypothetical protein
MHATESPPKEQPAGASAAPKADLGLPPKGNYGEAVAPVFKYFSSITEMGIIKVFIDHQIFDAIPDEGDISLTELAEKCGADIGLLERFTHFLIAAGILSSPVEGRVAHTKISVGFKSKSRLSALLSHLFDFTLGPIAQWPKYFEQNGLTEPKQANKVPVGLALGHPDKTFYEILETSSPDKTGAFNNAMVMATIAMPATGMYDFKWVGEFAQKEEAKERPLIVDVGGGKGQALKAIFAENPEIPPARCVLFDRPDTIKEVKEEDDELIRPVQKVEGSFLESQPIKGLKTPFPNTAGSHELILRLTGALVYHIRRVLNDWPDANVVEILSHIRSSCVPDSRVLISEQLLLWPPKVFNSVFDIFMMNFGGKRRSVRMFSEIASKAGFKVTEVFKDEKSDTAVIELVPV